MKIRAFVYLTLLIGFSYLFYNYKLIYQYSDLKEYLSALLTASSMVFTIMGIWIAFIYPNALLRLANPDTVENADFSQSLTETKRLEGLVGSVLGSAFVVTLIMLMYLSRTIVMALPMIQDYVTHLKSFSLSFAILLGVIQFESILYVIFSNVMFINDLHSKREDRVAGLYIINGGHRHSLNWFCDKSI